MMAQPRRSWRSVAERVALLATLAVTMSSTLLQAQEAAPVTSAFVAGTTPDRRPPSAPQLKTYDKSPAWFEHALTGVSKPIPPSLGFLESQGGWFTPFTRPGMPGLYDIRGLHAARASQTGEAVRPHD